MGFDQSFEWFSVYQQYITEQDDVTQMLHISTEGEPHFGLLLKSRQQSIFSSHYVESLSNYYTSLFQPLICGDDQTQRDLISGFISSLGEGSLSWDVLTLEPLDGEALFFSELLTQLDAKAYRYYIEESFINWYLVLNGRAYKEYAANLPSRLKNTIARKQRKLSREKGYDIRLFSDQDDISEFIQAYETIYQLSWKPEESHPEFISAVIRLFAKTGWLRLCVMFVKTKPVAVQLWFVKEEVASIYKLAHDPEYDSYSVGSILTDFMMKHVIDEDKVENVDFLTGDDNYKQDWMSHSRARYRIVIFNKRTVKGTLLAWKQAAKQRVRGYFKRIMAYQLPTNLSFIKKYQSRCK